MRRKGVYPGTFDPATHGHMDVIGRALLLFDTLIIGVAVSKAKKPLFTPSERIALLQQELNIFSPDDQARVSIQPFNGLLVDFVQEQGADAIVRGLRAMTDFEYEFQMAWINARLQQGTETVFLMASERYQFVSSSSIKEIACLGGDVTPFVSPAIAAAVKKRCKTVEDDDT